MKGVKSYLNNETKRGNFHLGKWDKGGVIFISITPFSQVLDATIFSWKRRCIEIWMLLLKNFTLFCMSDYLRLHLRSLCIVQLFNESCFKTWAWLVLTVFFPCSTCLGQNTSDNYLNLDHCLLIPAFAVYNPTFLLPTHFRSPSLFFFIINLHSSDLGCKRKFFSICDSVGSNCINYFWERINR